MLKRNIEEYLINYYKNSKNILVVDGARQVGKSFIIRETASKYFKNYVEINLKDDFDDKKKFLNIKSSDSFYDLISAEYGEKLNNYEDTIIFLDEIQVYPHILSLLKALKQEQRYHYICSGSLLGVTLKHTFIPMGAIDEIKMYPLTFEEFLINFGCKKEVIDSLKKSFLERKDVNEGLHESLMNYFKRYLIVGGLPACVDIYLNTRNISLVRKKQEEILSFYKDDCSQYDKMNALKVRNIFDSLPSYMGNKVNRIIFKNIENNRHKNALSYKDEFDYLVFSGSTIKVNAISNPHFPLIESESKDLTKLYFNDVGLLSNLLFKNNINSILEKDSDINLGSLYETVVAEELNSKGIELYYFDSKKVGEVDFLISSYSSLSVLPIEIKSGKNFNNFRAIPKLVKEPYSLKEGYIFANTNKIIVKDNLIIYPIYMIMFVENIDLTDIKDDFDFKINLN